MCVYCIQRANRLLCYPPGLKRVVACAIFAAIVAISPNCDIAVAQQSAARRPEPTDHPAEAAAFRESLLRNEEGQIPLDALPKAARRVEEMRQEVASKHGFQAENLAALAGRGQSYKVAGIPVGPLPRNGTNLQGKMAPLEIAPLDAVISPADWIWLGPGNIGGRVRSIAVHPTNPRVMWLGSVGGGVWKTENAGLTWAPLTDLMSSLAISSLVVDSANPDTLYAGTGEGFYNIDAIRGFGIYKSVDGGRTWNQLASTAGANAKKFQFVNRLAFARGQGNSQILLAATREGLYRSTDGGNTFSSISTLVTEVLDVRIFPQNLNYCVAGAYNGKVFYSDDAGKTWQPSQGISAVSDSDGRTEVTFARAQPSSAPPRSAKQIVVYASVDDSNGKVYRSLDGGKTFTLRSTPGHLAGQGWYANAIWADDPRNPNLLLIGGQDLYRSINGGASFTKISNWQLSPESAHADHHTIVSHCAYNGTTNHSVFFGNDGGVYRADDITTVQQTSGWTAMNRDLGVTQLYGAAGVEANGRLVGGAQDNGTLMLNPNGGLEDWSEIYGGDGGECAADLAQDDLYGEYVFLQIHRSINGQPSQDIYQGITDANNKDTALFIAPFILDPNNYNTMVAGGAHLWRTTDVKDTQPVWNSIKDPVDSTLVSAIAIVSGDSQRIWVGYKNGRIYRSTTGLDTNPTWIASSIGLPPRQCTRIYSTPGPSSPVYATFSGYAAGNLLRTDDNGAHWTPVGINTLPQTPFYDVTTHPAQKNILILGTEVGLFVSDDGGTTWSPTNQGPTNASVYRLFWQGETLHVATHGRGVFKINLSDAGQAPTPVPQVQSVAD